MDIKMSWIPQSTNNGSFPGISTFSLVDTYSYPISFTTHNGILYVSDIANNKIYTADPLTGDIISIFFTNTTNPCGLTTDSSGYMYTCENGSGRIIKIQISNPANYSTFTTISGNPFDMVIYQGYMYASVLSGGIAKINMSNGAIVNANWATGLSGPSQMVLLGTDIYVGCIGGGIYKIPIATGIPVLFISTSAHSGAPAGLSISSGYLYTTDSNGSGIDVYNFPSGTLAQTGWQTTLSLSVGLYAYNGRMYAGSNTGSGAPGVSVFGLYDTTLFNLPYGIADYNGILYVADFGNQSIYTADPTTLAITSTFIDSSNISGFRPCGIVVYNTDIYVSDLNSGRIYRVPIANPAGYSQWSSGIPGPYSMAVDVPRNTMYVTSSSTGNIFTLNLTTGGVVSANWGANYHNPSQMVMYDPDNLYVADQNGVYLINLPTPPSNNVGTRVVDCSNSTYTGLTILTDYFYVTSSVGAGTGNVINVYNFPSGSAVSLPWQSSLIGSDYLYNYNGSVYATEDNNLLRYNPYGICFLKGTRILCEDGYKPIEEIVAGELVKTLFHGYIPVDTVKHSTVYNPDTMERTRERLYLLSKSVYPSLLDNLVVTGGHSILVPELTAPQRKAIIDEFGTVFVTENQYRLMASVDERSVPYPFEGTFDIYHICLENEQEQGNYGIYANGLLVESCPKRHI